jgi:hypothetical protein
MSPSEVLIRTVEFSLPVGDIHEIRENRQRRNNDLFRYKFMNRLKLVMKSSVNVSAKIFNFEHYRKY